MAFWKKLFSDDDPDRIDYYREGEEMLVAGKTHEALTSFRLALKESPGDPVVLQQIAMCYTRIGMVEEAAKTYRHVLQKDPGSAGANYGLAFILLHSDRPEQCIPHLEAFLANPPEGGDAEKHIDHARRALAKLRGDAHDRAPAQPPPDDLFE